MHKEINSFYIMCLLILFSNENKANTLFLLIFKHWSFQNSLQWFLIFNMQFWFLNMKCIKSPKSRIWNTPTYLPSFALKILGPVLRCCFIDLNVPITPGKLLTTSFSNFIMFLFYFSSPFLIPLPISDLKLYVYCTSSQLWQIKVFRDDEH